MCFVFSLTLYLFATGSPQSDHRGMIKKEILTYEMPSFRIKKNGKSLACRDFFSFSNFWSFSKITKVPFSFFIKFSKLIVCFFCNSAVRRTNCRITFVFEDCFSFSFYP